MKAYLEPHLSYSFTEARHIGYPFEISTVWIAIYSEMILKSYTRVPAVHPGLPAIFGAAPRRRLFSPVSFSASESLCLLIFLIYESK